LFLILSLSFQQEGYLCAQHCLNALLQGPYFSAVDLATLGQQMDEQERERMAENGVDSEEYRNFIQVRLFCTCYIVFLYQFTAF